MCGAALGPGRLASRGLPYRRCAACGIWGLAAMPTDAERRLRYETAYPRMFTPSRIRTPRREMLTGVLAQARRHAAPGRLLDVGCGGGHFLQAARADGWRGVGTDLSHAACLAARATAGAPMAQAEATPLPFPDRAPHPRTLPNLLCHTAPPPPTPPAAAPALAAAASGGRWLLGPSLEVYARRLDPGAGHP